MRTEVLVGMLAGVTVLCAAPAPASAQYKNTSFGFDVSGWLITKPSVHDADGNVISNPDSRPLRLENGLRVGGESNFKLSDDHWWVSARANIAALQFASSDNPDDFDSLAKENLGTLVGTQLLTGFRYVIFTDKVRPYVQASISYMRLTSFASAAGNDCGSVNATWCATGTTAESNFLPHPNVFGGHITTGVDFLFMRDLAVHLYVDGQRWFVLNASDNNSIAIGIGIIFFT